MRPSKRSVNGISSSQAEIESKLGKRSAVAKRLLDISGALIFFILFSWVFLLVWVAVLMTTGRPAIYRHKRVGRHGKEFNCLKFRSMVPNSARVLAELLANDVDAWAEWNSTFKLRNDPRITKFGRFIRKTSLDELPQFWNVLRGDMSLVGPRPVMREELDEHYGLYAPVYCSVRPGITGPWQIGGRSTITYSERVAMDVEYVHNGTALGDLQIVLQTATVFFSTGSAY